jgi:hypothetical protein
MLAPTPASPPVVAAPLRRKSGVARVVDGLLVLSLVVAAGGIGFAVGRQTAPASIADTGARRVISGALGTGTPGDDGTSVQGAAPVMLPSGAPTIAQGSAAPAESVAHAASPAPRATTGTGGPGPQGGLGRGGLSGTVTAVDEVTITISTAGGQELQVTTTDSTTYHEQVATSADTMAVGSPVRIQVAGPPGAFAGPGSSTTSADQQLTATEVERLEALPGTGATGSRGPRSGVNGTVSAIDAASVTVTTTDGQATRVLTDDATTWVLQTTVTRDAVSVGSPVRLALESGSGGQEGQPGQEPSGAALTVSDVEVLLPASG